MAKIPTVRLYHSDGGQIRVNKEDAEHYTANGWSEEEPSRSAGSGSSTKSRPNLKAVNKDACKSNDKEGD